MRRSDDNSHIAKAARWFAHMRGPDAEASRAEFTAWIAAAPYNLANYNEIAELFGAGKFAKGRPPAVAVSGATGFLPALMLAGSVAVCIGLLILPADVNRHAAVSLPRLPTAPSEYVAPDDRARGIGLSDGSMVTLAPGSRLQIDFTNNRRALTVLAGRIRFDVAHDRRPFVVLASASETVAHGTIFDVTLKAHGQSTVHLLEGVIDVRGRRGPHAASEARLIAGQRINVNAYAFMTRPPPSLPDDDRWLKGTIDYDAAPLASVLATVNRQSSVRIELDDLRLGRMRLSGSFSLDDPQQLVRALTAIFNLQATYRPGKRVALGIRE